MSGPSTLLKLGVAGLVAPTQLAPLVAERRSGATDVLTFSGSGTPKTASVTTTPGQLIVVMGGSEDTATVLQTPTGNGLTWTLEGSWTAPNNSWGGIWSAVDNTGGTWTLSQDRNGNIKNWGWSAFIFPAGSTIGAKNGAAINAASALTLTTQAANSAILLAVYDWNIQDVATDWPAVNGFEPTAPNQGQRWETRVSGAYNTYGAYYPDAGAAGAKSLGMNGLTFNHVLTAVEIKDPVAGGGFDPRRSSMFLASAA